VLFFAAIFLTGSGAVTVGNAMLVFVLVCVVVAMGTLCPEELFAANGRVAGRANAAAGFTSSSFTDIFPGDALPNSESSLTILMFAFTSPKTFLFAALTAPACNSVEKAGVDFVR